jgi:CRP/FNR family transcriptional regulator, cyclic AMP receptor protein
MGPQPWPVNSLLATLSPATREELLALGTRRQFQRGQVLLREGELSTHVILLVQGCVKVTATTPNGGLALLAIRMGGEIIGELAGLDGQPRSATATAAGLVRSRVMPRTTFHDFLTRHPDAALAVGRSVGAKLRWATRRRVDFSGYEVPVRVARVLAELAVAYGEHTGAGVEIQVPLTQPELAALVGAAEPTVHKALAKLRRRGVIVTGYRQMTVLDLAELRAAANPAEE